MSDRRNCYANVESLGNRLGTRVCVTMYFVAIFLPFTALPAQTAELPKLAPVGSDEPAPQLEQLHYFEGTWTCSATGVTTPFHPVTNKLDWSGEPSTWTVKRVLNNYWFLGQEEIERVITTQDSLGFNTLTKRFGRTILSNRGEFINLLSDGWVKRTWIWEGSTIRGSGKSMMREMIEKTNDRSFVSTYFTLDTATKKWYPRGNKVCKKSS